MERFVVKGAVEVIVRRSHVGENFEEDPDLAEHVDLIVEGLGSVL